MKKGFTLIELLAVILILGIIAIPTVNKIITNIESKTSEAIGTISITGVDNISKVDTTTANSKYWNII